MRAWPVLGITILQAILLFAHWFLYRTLIGFFPGITPATEQALRVALLALSFSFVVGALAGFRFSGVAVRLLYGVAAVWLGVFDFLLCAACLCRLAALGLRLAGQPVPRLRIAGVLFGLALLVSVYGIVNARLIRVRRIEVGLPNLPGPWRGRTAVMFSDLHLGHINGLAFSRRIAALARRCEPDIVFMAGDLFDGTPVDPAVLAGPLGEIAAPLGSYFVLGNHEEFGDSARFTAALERAGIRVLNNEKVEVEGVDIAGIPYHDSTSPIRVRAILSGMGLDASRPSILLNHAPARLPIVEQAGVSLQLSGHTHGGQIFPFTWITRRAFGKFTYGLQRLGSLQVYTSYGAGTWGPPMRVGTSPEIVVIRFELAEAVV